MGDGSRHFHSSDRRHVHRLWEDLGGTIARIRRTGELRFAHPAFDTTVKINGRRKDVPAVLLNRINRLLKGG